MDKLQDKVFGYEPSVAKNIAKNNRLDVPIRVERFTSIWDLLKWLVENGWEDSNSKLRHLLDGGGVYLNDRKLEFNDSIELNVGDVIKVGGIYLRITKLTK